MKCIRFAFVVSGLLTIALDGNAAPFRFDDASILRCICRFGIIVPFLN